MGRRERAEAAVASALAAAASAGAVAAGVGEDGVQVGVFDCVRCGACCVNSAENRAEAYPWYVEVDDRRSPLLRVADLRRRFTCADPSGRPHLRLDPAGRCLALGGRLGAEVACAVYEHRPAGCRRVTAGDADCRRARVEQGLVPEGAEGALPGAGRARGRRPGLSAPTASS